VSRRERVCVCMCLCPRERERELKSGECVRVSGRERGLDGRERERVLTGSKVKLQYESVCVCVCVKDSQSVQFCESRKLPNNCQCSSSDTQLVPEITCVNINF